MKKKSMWYAALLLGLVFSGCVNLKQVHDYSAKASAGITKFEEIPYSFQQHCLDRCRFGAVRTFSIREDKADTTCDCGGYQKADSVTLMIYQILSAYFSGLADLSNDELTHYNLGTLEEALVSGNFGDVQIGETEVKAFSAISGILLRASTDLYRQKKLSNYIGEANDSLQVLLQKFSFILHKNLRTELDAKKTALFMYYGEITRDSALSVYEKGKATLDYYEQIGEASRKQQQIDVFTRGLKAIADGHQQLFENRNRLTAKQLRGLLKQYATDLHDIIAAFNKLKNK